MVVIALVIAGDDSVREQAWSTWKPSHKDPDIAAVEIAQHVGHEYRQDSGDQLVDVYAQRLEIGGTPLNVVIRSTGKGIGALRTHAGDAHGREKGFKRIDGRIARLEIYGASTLALFLIETLELRQRRPLPQAGEDRAT